MNIVRKTRLWNRIERNLKSKFPKELKAILNITGFDSELSLKQIDEKAIKSIEQFVNENIASNNLEVLSALKGSTYENKSLPFHFLLGHKLLILSIPTKVDLIEGNKTKRRNRLDDDSEESEIRSPEEHKKLLLLKLKKYAENHALNFEFNESNITKIQQLNKKTKCVLKCCFCERKIPCTFVNYWEISNLIKHIRDHFENSKENSNQNSSLSPDGVPIIIVKPTQSTTSTQKPRQKPAAKPVVVLIKRAQPNVLNKIINLTE